MLLLAEQGVALTGRNTTGPQRAAPCELHCMCSVADDGQRRQAPTTVTSLAPYILCVGGPVITSNHPVKEARHAYCLDMS